MDEFAQTRQPDDLFDDDFTPIVIDPTLQGGVSRNYTQRGHLNPPTSATRSTAKENDNDEAPKTTNMDPTPRASQAVRGDRSATGGVTKPKLTESELSARLEAVKINNARREEAHRLAEADEASFQKREAQEIQKRREIGVAREMMEKEREKNRLRKLGAQSGREWDEGKKDQPVSSPGQSQYRRGVHGGVAYSGRGPWGRGDPGWQQDNEQDDGRGEDGDRDPRRAMRGNFLPGGSRSRGDRRWQQDGRKQDGWQQDGWQQARWQEESEHQNRWAEDGVGDQGNAGRGNFAQRGGRGRGKGPLDEGVRGAKHGGRGRGGGGGPRNFDSSEKFSGPPAIGHDAFPPLPVSSRPEPGTSSEEQPKEPSETTPPTSSPNLSAEPSVFPPLIQKKSDIDHTKAQPSEETTPFSPVEKDSSWADQVEAWTT